MTGRTMPAPLSQLGTLPLTLCEFSTFLANELAALPQVLNPQEDASIILELVCDLRLRDLLMSPHQRIPSAAGEREAEVLRRARAGMPLAYALGEWFFAGRRFFVDDRVVIPRPDTEVLLAAAKDFILERRAPSNQPLRVLELGTGSGALIVSLLADDHLEAVATDVSHGALAVALRNARRHGVRLSFLEGDLLSPLQAGYTFDLILSNPPYVAKESDLEPCVLKWEPKGGLLVPNGQPPTYYHRRIASEAGEILRAGSWLGLEVGEGQAAEVAHILEDSGFSNVGIRCDLSGTERVVSGYWRG